MVECSLAHDAHLHRHGLRPRHVRSPAPFPIIKPCSRLTSNSSGKAIALRLAKDGYDVCVNDISANQAGIDGTVGEIEKLGRKAVGVVADVSKRAEVDNLVKKSVQALGNLDTMVANAGIAQVKALLDLTEEDVEVRAPSQHPHNVS